MSSRRTDRLQKRRAKYLEQFSLTRDEVPAHEEQAVLTSGPPWAADDPYLRRVIRVALLKHGGPSGVCRVAGRVAEKMRAMISIARSLTSFELRGALGRVIAELHAKTVVARAPELTAEYRELEREIVSGLLVSAEGSHALRLLRADWVPGTRYASIERKMREEVAAENLGRQRAALVERVNRVARSFGVRRNVTVTDFTRVLTADAACEEYLEAYLGRDFRRGTTSPTRMSIVNYNVLRIMSGMGGLAYV